MANGTIAFDTLSTSGQITGTAKTVDTDYVVNGSAKAWVDGTDAAALNDSFNIGSGTDHGTGDYSYAMSTAFATINYSQNCTVRGTGATHNAIVNTARDAAGVLAIETSNDTANADIRNAVVAHGDLA